MNVSVNWVRALVPGLEGTARELADRLTMAAVAVDAVEPVGEALEGIVVARVLDVEPHPDADRLTLCRVDPGTGDAVDVVCGAPVVEAGALYPYAPPGAVLPGGLAIERRKIRGVESHGMLCSEAELELGRDRGGILRLADDLRAGQSLSEALGLPDARLVLDLTPNRVDLACHLGVARELAPEGEAGVALPPTGARWEPRWVDGEEEAEAAGVGVRIDDPDRCVRYLAAVIRGVEVGPSPAWLAGRLRAAGLRPLNNVVDATNYVLMELNQPIHAFDLDRLEGGRIRVRAAAAEEGIRTLDGVERKLDARVTVIADAERPAAVAGVMGGEDSEVTRETRDILLECAAFDPGWVRRSARGLGLSTEASYRFERGIDETGLERALVRCVALVLATAGGTAEEEGVRVGRPAPSAREVPLRPDRVRAVLGIEPGEVELRRLLEPLGFRLLETEEADGAPAPAPGRVLRFQVPGWRRDVTREVDLLEEVARRHGYDRFPREERRFRASAVADDPAWDRADRVRSLLVGRGLIELRSSSFVPAEQGGGHAEVPVLNPLSAAEGHLRSGLVPVLLRRAEHNFARGRRDIRLFEIGTVFGSRREEEGVEGIFGGTAVLGPFREELRAALLLTGRRQPPHWTDGGDPVDLWELKGLAAELAETRCRGVLEALRGELAGEAARLGGLWLGGEAFRILKGEETVGVAGRVRPEAVDAPPWAGDLWAAEFRLDAVEPSTLATYTEVAAYPAVRRDLAVTVPRGVEAGEMEAAIRRASAEILESVRLFDVYEGEGVEEGRRSLAWSFRFRSAERTLTDPEADAALKRIVSALEEAFDARVRAS